MDERRRPIAKSIMIAILATGLSPAADALAAESAEVQELRREISQLRADTQVLQAALVQAAELDQRSANLLRAGNEDSSQPAALPPAVPAPSSVAVTETRSPTTQSAPSSGGDRKVRSKSRHRRHRRVR